MAITSFDITCDKIPIKSSCSTHSSKCDNSCRLLKINFAADGSLSSVASKRGKSKKMNSKSPYLTGDRVQLLSRVTEKRLVHKKTTDFVSSFPLAVNIYKANSDEFKSSRKVTKKVKKSVLTLPNDPAPVPQVCTVSDVNDSEYCAKNDEDRKQKVIKKRTPIQSNRKARVREKDFEFYDRDAQYCSQLNINLDCSSTDLMKNFNGDGKRMSTKKKILPTFHKPQTTNNNLSDVWTVLRNMNRFQFRPSPPMSEESIIPIKKKVQKRRTNLKDTRVIETCRTEEFAYISSYEVDEKTPRSFSPSSSIDRITVIDKQNEFSKICEEFEKRLLKTHDFLKESNNSKTRNQRNKIQFKNAKNNVRNIGNFGAKENKQVIPLKKKKRMNLKSSNSSENRDSLIDGDFLQLADNSDVLSHKTVNDSMYAVKGSITYSDCSDSSKGALPDKTKNERTPVKDKPLEEPSSHLKSIPKAVLSPEQPTTDSSVNLVEPKRFDPQKRKPRLVTTMPSSCMMPKLTQTEIKRRLAQLRFPIVILGKDQVSSHITVSNYDPPQFNGLDDHIWPFMLQWSDDSTKELTEQNNTNRKCNSVHIEPNSNKSRKINAEIGTYPCKQTLFNKKQIINDSTINKKKIESKRLIPSPDMNDKLPHPSKKQKSIVQLKEKMLNFLYKKSSSRNVVQENQQNDTDKCAIAVNKVDAATDTQGRPITFISDLTKRRACPSPIKKTQNFGYPWAKAKWASDFIESVIKKIRSGVYYSQDHVIHKYRVELKEVSVQAGSLCDSSDTQTYDSDTEFTQEVAITSTQKSLTSIPGFNNTLPLLEIKTLNMNQISVKHCVTNVMVQFDVTVPTKNDKNTESLNKSLSLIPIEVTESQTKIYKCKTTILNAMLPAELCSILPKMMSNIMNSNVNSDRPALCPAKTDSCLSTITELTRYEAADSLSIIWPFHMSTEIKHILEGGRFSKKTNCFKNLRLSHCNNLKVNYDYRLVTELLPMVSLKDLLQYEVGPLVVELNNTTFTRAQLSLHESNKPIATINNIHPTCTAVDVYKGNNNETLKAAFTPFSFIGMIKNMLNSYNLQINRNLASYFQMLKLQYDGKNIEICISMKNSNGVQNNVSVTVSNLKIDSLYKALPKVNNNEEYQMNTNSPPLKCIEYINNAEEAPKSENTEVNLVTSNKIKRKGFYKLYRKCKSTTNIPSTEKCVNTPLNKVTTLDDFFQILGSKKMLCSVFDGYAAKKILSSIIEIKNWITEINPRQALLILLLTNKKDTPNLVRFRPILLQGIAVNRITRATELDMEIEVIERENLNKFSQYEGISYLPESVTNYDNLLEELYWIAKTTASDYQRPFDESSERLLKSLLEKRKKLNPSYLRVMARYVGLGLLKPPMKN